MDDEVNQTLTIGELSKLTGISTHTLRMWERRFGSPVSKRLPSGHRRYPKEEVDRLRAIAKALDSGYRAGKVVTKSLTEIQDLLGYSEKKPGKKGDAAQGKELSHHEIIRQKVMTWVEAAKNFDEQFLSGEFAEEWGRSGPLEFISRFVGPFVREIGLAWKSRELSVAQEHFASERLSDFLGNQWRRLNERKTGDFIVMTTLPGEGHGLGIQMAAVVTALTEFKILYLGPNTPLDDIASTVKQRKAFALVLSVSNSMDPSQAEEFLYELRNTLPKKINLVTGGEGAPKSIPGIKSIQNFHEYYTWLLKQ